MLQTEIAWSKRTSRRSRKSARLKSDLPMHMLVRSSFKVCTGQFYCYPIKGVLNIKHFYKLFINLCVHSTHSSGPLSVMWIPFLWTHTAKHNNTKSFFMTFDVHAQIKRNTEKNTHTRNQRENERKRGKIDRRGFDDIVYYRETRKRKRKGKLKMIRPILNGQVFVPIYFCVYFVYDHKIKVGKRRRKHVFNCRLFWTVLDRCLQSYIYIGSSVAQHNACAFGRSPQIMVCVCAYAVDVALFFFYYPEIVVNASSLLLRSFNTYQTIVSCSWLIVSEWANSTHRDAFWPK